MQVKNGLSLSRRWTSWGLFGVLLIASLNAGCIGLAGSSTKPPGLTDSAPATSSVSATSAMVNWTTNEPSTSQVVYGPTTDYGQATPFNSTMVTSHTVPLTNLTNGIQYHYMCQSRAADGSTVTTPDATFTTNESSGDTTPPTVSITAPLNGATVSGTVTVSANAADDVAVASVQFQLDGSNLGAAVTAAPYNLSWDTTTATTGNHTLTAMATDTSGNAATSTGVTVTVNNNDVTPPSVSITSPANNATVNGTVTVSATASDNVGIASVQFQVDGANAGAAVTSAPYNFSWNTTSVSNASHMLTAVAKDAAGNAATSAVVTVTVNNADTTPPTVSITSPANNATVNGTVTVSATAADNVGVASVQLQVDGANVGAADTSAPYNFSWNTTSVSNASHTLTAIAKDAAGNTTTSASVKVTVNNSDTTPPTVSITSPANNATVNGTVTVSATASDNVGVASVQLQVDGANVGAADTSAPYNFSWNTTSVSNASHTLTAVAKDAAGNATTSASVKVTVNNADTTPPTVSITSPANNATVNGTVTVSATAADNVGVASVQLQVDGANVGAADTSSPYNFSWNTTSVSNASHTLTAIAKDAAGNATTSASVKVTVNNADTTPPTVSITSPANNATVNGTVTVSTTASDNVGVASVQLQVDGANVGAADTSAPYNFSWNTTSVSNASHTLTAVAKDAAGNTTTSASVKVTVNNGDTTPPTVSISSPANNATVSSTVSVSATASDNVGVATVQFQVDGNNVGSADTSSPYNFSWDTTSYANGSHALTAIAKDAAGNSAVSSTVNVTVNNQSSGSGGIPTTLGWFDVQGQQQANNCPPNNFNGWGYNFSSFCGGVVRAWSGGIADTKRNRLWFWGGGHTDYAGNELYYFDLTTLKVVRADDPAQPTQCNETMPDGSANARHTYGGLVYIPTADRMFLFGGGSYCSSGNSSSDTWTLDLSKVGSGSPNGWQRMDPTNGSGTPCGDFNNSEAAYDPNTDLVFVNDLCGGSGLWSYNWNTNTYVQLNTGAANLGLHTKVVIDPTRKLFLRFGDGTASKISIASGSSYAVQNLTASGCSGLMNANSPGLAFDTVQNLVVGWPDFGGTIYLYNPDTDSCTTQTYSASAPADSAHTGSASTTNGTFGRFQYFPSLGVFALINDYNIDAHTLRLTAASGSGSNLIISNVAAGGITTTSATVSWSTSTPGTSQVMYGKTSGLGSSTTKNGTMSTAHSQTISGLTSSTLYFFSVQSVDSGGNPVTASGFTFGTTNTTDNTPPTVSLTAPANNATVSGAVTVSANASDNVAVASVQFLLDGANLGSAITASPYSMSWNTSTASNGSHTIAATATDSSGNTTTSAAVTVTVSNSTSNALADFQSRCAGSGVIRCIGFDTSADIQGNAAPGMPKIMPGLTTPAIDATESASGGGSLLFTVPASADSQNTSGSFDINFADDFSAQIDSLINGDPASKTTACGGKPCGNEIWIQWRQRFDQNMLQQFAGSNGFKQIIVGEGDTASTLAYSCTDIDLVMENSNQMDLPRMYHSCGVKLDTYDPLTVNTGRTNGQGAGLFSPQNAAGGYLNCTYVAEQNIPTIPPCVPYVANQWMTFQVHIKVGTWYPGGVNSSGGPPGTFKHDTTIQMYVAQEGQPSQIVLDFRPGATSAACDAQQSDIPSCQTGYDLANPTAYGQPAASGTGNPHVKFGKVWLLPYQTDKCNAGCPNEPAAHTWYDELIISRQQIPDPQF
jgi:hypothetical protein